MTDTPNTPIEALKTECPLLVKEYAYRPNSGGTRRYRGRLGVKRSVTVQIDAAISMLTERQRHPPQGMMSGTPNTSGKNFIDRTEVPANTTRDVAIEIITVLTSGGAECGNPDGRAPAALQVNTLDGKTEAETESKVDGGVESE
jgi:N-methylhydantoinase B